MEESLWAINISCLTALFRQTPLQAFDAIVHRLAK
jgi:hypothetical protein